MLQGYVAAVQATNVNDGDSRKKRRNKKEDKREKEKEDETDVLYINEGCRAQVLQPGETTSWAKEGDDLRGGTVALKFRNYLLRLVCS